MPCDRLVIDRPPTIPHLQMLFASGESYAYLLSSPLKTLIVCHSITQLLLTVPRFIGKYTMFLCQPQSNILCRVVYVILSCTW